MSDSREMFGLSSEELKKQAAYSGDPWRPANPYFAKAELHMQRMWDGAIHPFIQGVDFTSTLDLAAGHGRNSALLLRHASRLTVMDIQPGNVDVCRGRFGDRQDISYVANNGYDFEPVANDSISFVYCFDAMVHFESDVVRSYLRDAQRILVPGGFGFFHHSNFVGGDNWKTNPGSRNFMSREFFAHYSRKEGLEVVKQQVINWGQHLNLDCFTLIAKPAAKDANCS